jgi:hypothetical protein
MAAADLGIIHVMLFCQNVECKSYRIVDATTEISWEKGKRPGMCDRVGVPASSSCQGDAWS